MRSNSKSRQDPRNVRNEPRISVIDGGLSLLQNSGPPICEDNNVEKTIDTRLVQTLPIPISVGDLAGFDSAPRRLDECPPLRNACCEGAEAVVWWELIRASSAGPPPNPLGSMSSGEHATDGGVVCKFKYYVTLE